MNPEFFVKVELYSDNLKTSEVVRMEFPTHPATFQEIQDKVEEICSIPVCDQTLYYHGSTVISTLSPSSLYLRSGDTIRVVYSVKGETKKVTDLVEGLKTKLEWLGVVRQLNKDEMDATIDSNKELVFMVQRIFSGVFRPYSDPAKYVNSCHFSSLGGVELLIEIHRQLIELRKEGSKAFNLAYFENVCCQASADYSMFKDCAVHLALCGGLENCIESFLMKPADDPTLLYEKRYSTVDIALCAIFK